jgi:hypothetical protein
MGADFLGLFPSVCKARVNHHPVPRLRLTAIPGMIFNIY